MNQLELQFEFEEWKPVVGYEGLYEVSNYGDVKSLNTNKIRCKKKDKYGYYCINLSKNGKRKTYFIHQLVARAFIPNPNNYPCVNHIDEKKTNNCVWNLEWCTHKYNNNYGNHIIKMINTFNSKRKPIRCIETQKIYESPNELDNEGFIHSFIYSCCRCDIECAYGLHWEYA